MRLEVFDWPVRGSLVSLKQPETRTKLFFCDVCFLQFGAETQQSKVAPSSAATRPIQSSREQVRVMMMSPCRQRRGNALFSSLVFKSQYRSWNMWAGFPQGSKLYISGTFGSFSRRNTLINKTNRTPLQFEAVERVGFERRKWIASYLKSFSEQRDEQTGYRDQFKPKKKWEKHSYFKPQNVCLIKISFHSESGSVLNSSEIIYFKMNSIRFMFHLNYDNQLWVMDEELELFFYQAGCFENNWHVLVNSRVPAGQWTSWNKPNSFHSCVFFQGGKSEIFVDVIERMSVVIGSNVSNMDAGRSVWNIRVLTRPHCWSAPV